jgi:signal transduction histidine kinase
MPRIFLITPDTKLRDAWTKLLDDLGDVEVSSPQDIRGKAERLRPCTIVYDLFQDKAPPYQEPGSGIHMVAIGTPGTVPFQMAVENNFFAVLDKDGNQAHLREITQHSQKILSLDEQNRFLQDRIIRLETMIEVNKTSTSSPPYRPFDYASEILSRISSEKDLSSHFLKLIHNHLRIPRSGVFINKGQNFELLSGNLVFGDIRELSYSKTHPFVEWLGENLITLRLRTVESTLDEPNNLFLRDNLKRMHAEAVFPLFSDGGLAGWLFTGKRNDGQPYSLEVLEDLESIAEQFSACLTLSRRQGSIQHEIQRAQLLLQSVPGKWVIANSQGEVIWQTQAGDPIPLKLKEALYDAAQSGTTTDTVDEGQQTSFRVFTRILPYSNSEYRIIGGYENVTDRLKMDYNERVQELDNIFNTLGLILSHELRNPLVSLKTFAQLLGVKDKNAPLPPDFITTIQLEVERLETVADDLFGLNDMGIQNVENTDIRMIINRIVQDLDHNIVTVKFGKNINPFQGDAVKLEEGLKDMILHMYNSLKDEGSLVILVEGKQTKGTQITVRGGGIEEEKTFPNSKTKSQPEAISLKFFKACQTIKKHRGLVQIRKSKNGYDLQILIREPS